MSGNKIFMKKYSLLITDKIIIALVLAIITYCLAASFQMLPKTFPIQGCQIFLVIVLWGFLGCFWIYLLTTLIKINQNKYKAIVINNNSKQIILYEAKNKVKILPFNLIDYIEIEKGFVVRGIALYQVRIISKNKTFIVNTSRIGNFCEELPEEMNVDIKQKFFFIAKVSE